ncbi:MAG: PHA-depolymerase-like protein [Casimicrobiaceae bacterium]
MRTRHCKFVLLYLVAAVGMLAAPAASAADALRAYNADIHETSVSGLSSGGYMAVQLDVAFSSIIKGAGIIAGGPYYCARGLLTTLESCMSGAPAIDVTNLVRLTRESAQRNEIDDVANLERHRIWLFSGGKDSVVNPSVADALEDYYKALVKHSNVVHRTRANAEHTMPTQTFGNHCPVKDDPYISDCNYDAAGTLLEWIYGTLQGKAVAPLRGRLLEFNQGEFVANPSAHGMADTGWVFVPENCSALAPCRLHVALHGCLQYPARRYYAAGAFHTFGSTFADHAGYNEWADTNGIIVLYPQAQRSPQAFWDITDSFGRNPKGCWDWWGYYDEPGYAQKTGAQMAAIRKMIDRITKGP